MKDLVMVGIVPYQLTGIQAGIQFKHASDEYLIKYKDDAQFWEWVMNHKTVRVVASPSTNSNKESKFYGHLNKLKDTLEALNIKHACFYEPDFGEQLAGIALICDREIFNRDYMVSNYIIDDEYNLIRLEPMDSGQPDVHPTEDYTYTKEKLYLNVLLSKLRFAG